MSTISFPSWMGSRGRGVRLRLIVNVLRVVQCIVRVLFAVVCVAVAPILLSRQKPRLAANFA